MLTGHPCPVGPPAAELLVDIGRIAQGAGPVVRRIVQPAILIGRHRIGITVFIVLVDGMRIRDYRPQVGAVIEIQGMSDAEEGEIALIIGILVGL